MKKNIVILLLLSVFAFSGCSVLSGIEETTAAGVQETTEIVLTVIPDTTGQETETAQVTTGTYENETTTQMSSSEEPSATGEPTTEAQDTTRPEQTTASQPVTEIDLGITMPEKNGTMLVDVSASNKFIEIVVSERSIDFELLAAVYSVPDSGQNYVFEFYDGDGREAEDIRRVYLIDTKGKITGVAAVNTSEKENVSSVENWFCMNVLIKELVYPAISAELK